eukprot:SRR837773.15816.p1 GENE.SRR837773.15816~~SRR837773.15816.p1  ORF type:complete len:193 (+),score=78.72 SRR837773.15816:104-682(+)
MGRMSAEVDFKIRWLPYQLAPDSSEEPSSKVEAYMKKFGRSKEQIKQMAAGMAQTFKESGLEYMTADTTLISNTYQAHRVLTASYLKGGQEAQDKAVEVLFRGYFSEGRAPSERKLLEEACVASGLDPAEVVGNRSFAAAETEQELRQGRQMVTGGVPHFVIRGEGGGGAVQFSGAQEPDTFLRAFARVAGK